MKILVLADKESPICGIISTKANWRIDLILSCGDLHPHYLSFLATFFQGPVLYVHGNHDDRYDETPPEGASASTDGSMNIRGAHPGAGRLHALQTGRTPVFSAGDGPADPEAFLLSQAQKRL